jgi:predicted nucleic acid-binding protein
MIVLVDTNVIGRLSQPTHEAHPIAVSATERLLGEGHELRVVPQVLYEFWAIATRPVEDNGFGFSVGQAEVELRRIRLIFPVLRDERGILERWSSLVVNYAVRGKTTHDARLVAAMQRHGVTHLLTFNLTDFRRYEEIQLLDPRGLVLPASGN